METYHIILLLLVGISGGILAGFLGVGGGLVFVPALTIYFRSLNLDCSENQFILLVIANSVFLTFLTSLVASLKQKQANNFYLKDVLALAIPGTIVSLLISYFIADADWFDKKFFGKVFIFMLIPMILKLVLNKKNPANSVEKQNMNLILIIGFLTGIIAALSGLGGGILIVPVFVGFLNYSMKKAGSVSVGSICLKSLALFIFYLFQNPTKSLDIPFSVGFIAFSVILAIFPGILIGAPIGVKLSHKVQPKIIKILFAVFFILVVIKMNL